MHSRCIFRQRLVSSIQKYPPDPAEFQPKMRVMALKVGNLAPT